MKKKPHLPGDLLWTDSHPSHRAQAMSFAEPHWSSTSASLQGVTRTANSTASPVAWKKIISNQKKKQQPMIKKTHHQSFHSAGEQDFNTANQQSVESNGKGRFGRVDCWFVHHSGCPSNEQTKAPAPINQHSGTANGTGNHTAEQPTT